MPSRSIAAAIVGVCAGLSASCDGQLTAVHDAGDDRVGFVDPDGSTPPPDASTRLTPHNNVTLAHVAVGVVYIGELDAGGAPVMTPTLTWLLGSSYWGLLSEYGIGSGSVVGAVRIATQAFFQPGDVDSNGLVDILVMESRIVQAIHGSTDGGVGLAGIAGAQSYVIFLPDDVNVATGHRGSYTYQTCIDSDGYHAYDTFEPYVVLPPCATGRSPYAASHEIAELATDPQPYRGWASDFDVPVNGGEVADLCAEQVMEEGVIVTRLWSNEQNGCVP